MLKSQLLHPQITAALARAGHGSKVLISDSNYPHWTRRGPNAEVVYLNLSPGRLLATEVLAAILTAIPVERAEVMDHRGTGAHTLAADPAVWDEYRALLRQHAPEIRDLERIERFAFYDAAGTPDVCLTVATADERPFANLLLTIGVVRRA
jgi:L-fucose mutarotase